jgi:hypothetical protein
VVVGPADPPAPGTVSTDQVFTREPSRGVEALAFVVNGPGGGAAAGIILRIPDEFPDSFETVSMPDPPAGSRFPDAIRAAFYG